MLDVNAIMYVHRGEQQSIQAEGHAAAMRGDGRDSPYGSSRWEHNHWLYGYMLGREDARHARV